MNEKVKELIKKMDDEILVKVDAKVAARDAEIKAKAQKAYDESVENSILEIKDEVGKEYDVARKYLESLLEPEEPKPVEEVAEAPIAPEEPKVEEPVAGFGVPENKTI